MFSKGLRQSLWKGSSSPRLSWPAGWEPQRKTMPRLLSREVLWKEASRRKPLSTFFTSIPPWDTTSQSRLLLVLIFSPWARLPWTFSLLCPATQCNHLSSGLIFVDTSSWLHFDLTIAPKGLLPITIITMFLPSYYFTIGAKFQQ